MTHGFEMVGHRNVDFRDLLERLFFGDIWKNPRNKKLETTKTTTYN